MKRKYTVYKEVTAMAAAEVEAESRTDALAQAAALEPETWTPSGEPGPVAYTVEMDREPTVKPEWYAKTCGIGCDYCRETVERHAGILQRFAEELGAEYRISMAQTGGHCMCLVVERSSTGTSRFGGSPYPAVYVTPNEGHFTPSDDDNRFRVRLYLADDDEGGEIGDDLELGAAIFATKEALS